MARKIACLGDSSTHGGEIITHNQDGRFLAGSDIVAVEGAIHRCWNPIHEPNIPLDTPITSIIKRCYCNGKLVLTEGAIAGCGAIIISPERRVYIGEAVNPAAYEYGFGSSKQLGNIY